MPNSAEREGSVRETPYDPVSLCPVLDLAARQGDHLLASTNCRTESVKTSSMTSQMRHSLISKPPKPAQHKQLPVVPPHANILDGLVDELGFHCVTS